MRGVRGLLAGVVLGLALLGAGGWFLLRPTDPGCGSAAFHPTMDDLSQPGVDLCPIWLRRSGFA